jgi:hypothetical protein
VTIRVTDEMKAAFRAAGHRRAAELVAEGAPLGGHDILDQEIAAVLAIVERDYLRVDGVHRGGRVCRSGNLCVYCHPDARL